MARGYAPLASKLPTPLDEAAGGFSPAGTTSYVWLGLTRHFKYPI